MPERLPFPIKKYAIIYADPPWKYENEKTGGSMKSSAIDKYPVLSIKEIKNLPIDSISEKDCCLFMWGTIPLLPEAIETIESWGFTYKTALIWRKTYNGLYGMGFWFRGQVEMLFLGVKGDVKAFHLQISNFYQSSVVNTEHSQKPDKFYEIIEKTGLKPRIELFARNHREGWDVWGNEAPEEITTYPKRRSSIDRWIK